MSVNNFLGGLIQWEKGAGEKNNYEMETKNIEDGCNSGKQWE